MLDTDQHPTSRQKSHERSAQVREAADPISVRNFSLFAGLTKNADAPARIAVDCTIGSSLLVKTMTRVEGERVRSRDCTSRPFIAGIRISRTTTSGWCACA